MAEVIQFDHRSEVFLLFFSQRQQSGLGNGDLGGSFSCSVRLGSSPCENVFGLSVVDEPGLDLGGFPDFGVLPPMGDVSGVLFTS
jgi:hypothetical protein